MSDIKFILAPWCKLTNNRAFNFYCNDVIYTTKVVKKISIKDQVQTIH